MSTSQKMVDTFLAIRQQMNDLTREMGGPETDQPEKVLTPDELAFMDSLYEEGTLRNDMRQIVMKIVLAGAMDLETLTKVFASIAFSYLFYGLRVEQALTSGAIPEGPQASAKKPDTMLGSIEGLEAMFKLEDNRQSFSEPHVTPVLDSCGNQDTSGEMEGAANGEIPPDWNA